MAPRKRPKKIKHQIHKNNLRRKGWSEEEIASAEKVLSKAESKKHPFVQFLDKIIFWLLLLVIIVGIFVFAIGVLPLIVMLDVATLVMVVLLVSLALGALFAVVVQDIHWLGHIHHGFALGLLPLCAVVAFLLVFSYSAQHSMMLAASPVMLGILFAVGLITPYFFHLLTTRR